MGWMKHGIERAVTRGPRALLALGLSLALLLSACAGSSTTKPQASEQQPGTQKPARKKIQVGLATVGAVQWPYYVAQAKGFYEEANLDMEIMVTESNTKAVQALIAGGIQIAGGSPDSLIKAVATGGADLIIVGSVMNKPIYSFITQSEITNYNDLKGKRVGVSALKSMDGLWMDEVLRKNGVRESVEIVEIGGTAARYAALKSKAVAGAWLVQPQDFQALGEGFKLIGYSTDVYGELIWSGYSTTRKIAAKDEELISRFLQVQRRAHQWLYDPTNKAEAISILAKEANARAEDAAKTYELWISQGSLTRDGEATASSVQSMIDYLVKAGELDPKMTVERVLVTTYMDKIMGKKP